MITKTTDLKIAEYFGNNPKTLNVWKKSPDFKMNERYSAFRQRLLFSLNGIDNPFGAIVDLTAKVKELEDAINIYVDKEEQLRGIVKGRVR
ncbi:MAG: hypothetical protein U9O83_01190 [Campylobacterota bacterium]|nr:hypothetical protein [Campylobacterota bacterium]